MGCYLKEHFGDKVASINHIYNGGIMFSRTSEGLKVHTITIKNSIFRTFANFENYYLTNIFNSSDFAGMICTRNLTASMPWKK